MEMKAGSCQLLISVFWNLYNIVQEKQQNRGKNGKKWLTKFGALYYNEMKAGSCQLLIRSSTLWLTGFSAIVLIAKCGHSESTISIGQSSQDTWSPQPVQICWFYRQKHPQSLHNQWVLSQRESERCITERQHPTQLGFSLLLCFRHCSWDGLLTLQEDIPLQTHLLQLYYWR